MQTSFKKNSVLTFLYLFLFSTSLLFSCSNKDEKRETSRSKIGKTMTLESSQFLKDEKKFNSPKASETTQKQTELSYQEAQKVISITSLKKGEKVEKQDTYLKKIAQLTQLEESKINLIRNKKGLREIEKIIITLPENDSKKEAQRLTTLMRFDRVVFSKKAKEYLLTNNNNILSPKERIEFYLDKFVEAAFLHSIFGEKTELNAKDFEKAKEISEITLLNFEKLAIIESQLGLLGLRSAILNIPDFPQKQEALKIISK